jgi:hypothetical protein
VHRTFQPFKHAAAGGQKQRLFTLLCAQGFSADARLFLVQAKLERRIKSVEVKVLNAPRPGKKLLVTDIDYTIFDLGSAAESPMDLARWVTSVPVMAALSQHVRIPAGSAISKIQAPCTCLFHTPREDACLFFGAP